MLGLYGGKATKLIQFSIRKELDWQAIWPIITLNPPSGKQIRQENRLISVDINLKNIVYWRLTADETKYILMFISCFK